MYEKECLTHKFNTLKLEYSYIKVLYIILNLIVIVIISIKINIMYQNNNFKHKIILMFIILLLLISVILFLISILKNNQKYIIKDCDKTKYNYKDDDETLDIYIIISIIGVIINIIILITIFIKPEWLQKFKKMLLFIKKWLLSKIKTRDFSDLSKIQTSGVSDISKQLNKDSPLSKTVTRPSIDPLQGQTLENLPGAVNTSK